MYQNEIFFFEISLIMAIWLGAPFSGYVKNLPVVMPSNNFEIPFKYYNPFTILHFTFPSQHAAPSSHMCQPACRVFIRFGVSGQPSSLSLSSTNTRIYILSRGRCSCPPVAGSPYASTGSAPCLSPLSPSAACSPLTVSPETLLPSGSEQQEVLLLGSI